MTDSYSCCLAFPGMEPMTLSAIVATFPLPLLVKFLMQDNKLTFYVGNDREDKTTFGDMEILKVYEEKYWSGNSIFSGKTCSVSLSITGVCSTPNH